MRTLGLKETHDADLFSRLTSNSSLRVFASVSSFVSLVMTDEEIKRVGEGLEEGDKMKQGNGWDFSRFKFFT